MGLLLSVPSLEVPQYALGSSITPPGVTVTASATPHTKGTWATLVATLPYEIYGLTVVVMNNTTAATQVNMLIDIGVGAAASEVVVLPNLMLSGPAANTSAVREILLPRRIAKGARLSARCQSNVASKTASVAVWLHGGGDAAPWPTFQAAETIGADTATSRGVSHTAGISGSFSTFADLGGPSSRPFKAILPMVQTGSDASMVGTNHYMEIGVGGNVVGRWFFQTNSNEHVGVVAPSVPLYRRFASGTQFQIRATGQSGTADDNYDFGLVGFS